MTPIELARRGGHVAVVDLLSRYIAAAAAASQEIGR